MSMPLGGRGDDDYDKDVWWEEQDMPYLSRDRRRAEGGEGNLDDGVDDEHVDGRVRGPCLADTGNGQRRRLRRDGDNDDNVEEGGLHPTTPQTTVTPELVEWLRSAGRDWQWAEEKRATLTMTATTNTSTGVSGVRIGWLPGMDDGGDRGATVTIMMMLRRVDRIPPDGPLCIKGKILIGRIPGMGDGGDRGVTVTIMMTSRRADRIPPH